MGRDSRPRFKLLKFPGPVAEATPSSAGRGTTSRVVVTAQEFELLQMFRALINQRPHAAGVLIGSAEDLLTNCRI